MADPTAKPELKGKIKFDLEPLTEDEQYDALAEEMYEQAKGDIVEQIKKSLKESGGRGDRLRGSWSRS